MSNPTPDSDPCFAALNALLVYADRHPDQPVCLERSQNELVYASWFIGTGTAMASVLLLFDWPWAEDDAAVVTASSLAEAIRNSVAIPGGGGVEGDVIMLAADRLAMMADAEAPSHTSLDEIQEQFFIVRFWLDADVELLRTNKTDLSLSLRSACHAFWPFGSTGDQVVLFQLGDASALLGDKAALVVDDHRCRWTGLNDAMAFFSQVEDTMDEQDQLALLQTMADDYLDGDLHTLRKIWKEQ